LAAGSPVVYMNQMVTNGPIEFATSLAPCAKDSNAAPNTWKNTNNLSTSFSFAYLSACSLLFF